MNPVGDLIASFNVLVRLSHAGLQDRVTPLVGSVLRVLALGRASRRHME